MNKKIIFSLAIGFWSVLSVWGDSQTPQNIILFIGDGMSTPQRMVADEFARKLDLPPLAMNRLTYQATMRTCSSDSLVTDSAAAATAMACGVKTYNHGVGIDPNGVRLTSVAEEAKAAGKKVGIVTTVTINHATPVGFYGHRKDRGETYALGLDLVASGFDLFAGGGPVRPDDKKNRHYKGSVFKLAEKAGYTVIQKDRAAFEALKPGCGKVWYVATEGPMPFAIDAPEWEGAPTLAEMTKKSLELLTDAKKGFFLMVEGGKIDYTGHANDAAANLREVLAFDDAVKIGLEFQKKNPNTLVVVTGDHETGGMTMGLSSTGYAFKMEKLAGQKRSAESLRKKMQQMKPQKFEDIEPYILENFASDFDEEEMHELKKAFKHDLKLAKKGLKDDEAYDAAKITELPTTVKRIFSRRACVGWTSGNHTALPVLTTSAGPGAERLTGFLDNTDLAVILKSFVK